MNLYLYPMLNGMALAWYKYAIIMSKSASLFQYIAPSPPAEEEGLT